jgi:aminoglycoside phosphotransferase (APT) family kinase protein
MSVKRSDARAILSKMPTFKGRRFKLVSIYNQHNEEKCFLAVSDSRSYKVRFATATSRHSVAREYQAYSHLHQQRINWVPAIHEAKLDEPACLVTSFAKGVSLDKSLAWVGSAPEIARRIRHSLEEIHQIEGDYYGHLGGPRYSTWQAFLDVRFWRHIKPLSTAKIIDHSDLKKIQQLYEEILETLSEVRPVLLHGDVKPANVIFDGATKETTIIDWELARFGDVDFEWSKLYRMSIRWPEYRRLVAEPILRSVFRNRKKKSAKLLLYNLYHASSFLTFELETGLPVRSYRLTDLEKLLHDLRLRKLTRFQGTGRL